SSPKLVCVCVPPVWPLQMQCYHCEETLLNNDCSSTKFIVNCTANIQDACQKEVMVGAHGGSRSVFTPSTINPISLAAYEYLMFSRRALRLIEINTPHQENSCTQTEVWECSLNILTTVPADGAVGVEVEGHQVFWTCELDAGPSILVLTTVPPHTDSLGVSTKTKAGLVTEDDPLPF
ncbi:hypothetical protein NFI96_020329, partial [Prochilodus magdalenae]